MINYDIMQRILVFFSVFFSFFFFLNCDRTKGQNVAVHKSYTFSEEPNYERTRGGDLSDLTDGRKKTNMQMWFTESTVGWSGKPKIEVDIDLKQIEKINNIRINTAQNDRGTVQFPAHAFVFLSNDARNYEYAGDAMKDYIEFLDENIVKEFELEQINKKARFVKLVFISVGKYLTLDEIEVNFKKGFMSYKGINEQEVLNEQELARKVDEITEKSQKGRHLFVEIHSILDNHAEKDKWTKSLSELTFENVEELEDLKNQIRNTSYLQTFGKISGEEIFIRSINIWENNFETELESKTENAFLLRGISGRAQYGGVMLVNTSESGQEYSLSLESGDGQIDFYRLESVPGTRQHIYDVLLSLKAGKISLEPRERAYVVFKILPKKNFESFINVKNSSFHNQLPVSAKVVPKSETTAPLNANVWAYLDYPVITDHKKEVISDLLAHQVNTVVVNGNHIPNIGDRNFDKLKKYLRNFENLSDLKILLYTNHSNDRRRNSRSQEAFLTQNWKKTFASWYQEMLSELSAMGVKESQVYWYPFDEIKKEHVQDFINLSKWAKQEVKNFQVFVTVSKKESLKVVPYANISQVTPSFSKEAKKKYPKAEIWQYTVIGMSREKEAYADYRLMAWEAFYRGYSGIGFWNYLDVRRNVSLNNYKKSIVDNANDFGVVYTDDNQRILTSKRWEAFNKGIEDYHILQMYAEKAGEKEAKDLVKKVLQGKTDKGLADRTIQEMMGLFE